MFSIPRLGIWRDASTLKLAKISALGKRKLWALRYPLPNAMSG
jgi:hypothetical protein